MVTAVEALGVTLPVWAWVPPALVAILKRGPPPGDQTGVGDDDDRAIHLQTKSLRRQIEMHELGAGYMCFPP